MNIKVSFFFSTIVISLVGGGFTWYVYFTAQHFLDDMIYIQTIHIPKSNKI
ncbi:MAG: hypothetical protein NTX85_00010 [Candidatus Nomurabacteria bacterium]|nr:hypothetical protein [Candidatus Nomurabacteria bacterium]